MISSEKEGRSQHHKSAVLKVLLHPSYFPNIATFSVIAQHETVWEVYDNFQKQTYRNRCYICTDQGRQLLNIPIRHKGTSNGRQRYRDVKIDGSYPWQRQHLKTLQTAYRASPFFEFYEDDLIPVFEQKFTYLLDVNLHIIELVCRLLGLQYADHHTEKYTVEPTDGFDARFLVNAKKKLRFKQEGYFQVFRDRHAFVENASILDLLFNQGPNSSSYLRSQDLSFLHA